MVGPGQRDWWREFLATRDAVLLPDERLLPPMGVTRTWVNTCRGLPDRGRSVILAHLGAGDGLAINDSYYLRRCLVTILASIRLADDCSRWAQELSTMVPAPDRLLHAAPVAFQSVNQTTTRSHVFIVYVACGFFEVVGTGCWTASN